MRDGSCVMPPKFSRDEVLEYLDGKIAGYRAFRDGASTENMRVFWDAKLTAATVIRTDIAAMGEG
jgi:hypothetical protein